MSATEVNVTIMGKQYRIACPPGEQEALQQAARHVNAKMTEISSGTKLTSLDRVAVFAALNLAHELLSQESDKEILARQVSSELAQIRAKIDSALAEKPVIGPAD